MSGMVGIPADLQGVSTDVLTTSVNAAWGQSGSGFMDFWKIYGRFVFRDTAATGAPAGRLQNLDGFYPVLAMNGVQYLPKGDTEARSRDEGVPGVLGTSLRAGRVDSKSNPIPLRPGFDPTGMINSAIMEQHNRWAMHLPQQVLLRLLVNNMDLWGNTAPVAYDGKALFATDHPVNQLDKKSSKTYSNIISLATLISEADFAATKDQMRRQALDFDGITLYNGTMGVPIVVVASDTQAMRWMRFVGGPRVLEQFHLQPLVVNGIPTGISSVSLGSAMIVVDPYIYQIASDQAAADLTSYIFPAIPGNRMPLILREEQTPRVYVSGESDWPGFNQKVKEVVSDAYVVAGPGEPRSVYKLIEKP